MKKSEVPNSLSAVSDEEVIGEAVKRLTEQYRKKGGRALYEVSFRIDPDWAGTYRIELCTEKQFYRGQPSIQLVEDSSDRL